MCRRDQNTLVSPALAFEARWPAMGAAACTRSSGVDSMMSLLVYTDEHSFGALSLYCGTGGRFEADDVAVAQALAGHVSVVMAAETGDRPALASRCTTGTSSVKHRVC